MNESFFDKFGKYEQKKQKLKRDLQEEFSKHQKFVRHDNLNYLKVMNKKFLLIMKSRTKEIQMEDKFIQRFQKNFMQLYH